MRRRKLYCNVAIHATLLRAVHLTLRPHQTGGKVPGPARLPLRPRSPGALLGRQAARPDRLLLPSAVLELEQVGSHVIQRLVLRTGARRLAGPSVHWPLRRLLLTLDHGHRPVRDAARPGPLCVSPFPVTTTRHQYLLL